MCGSIERVDQTDQLSQCLIIYCSCAGVTAEEGWVCDFEGRGDCIKFHSSGWVNHNPQRHTDDIEYEPDHDHTKNHDYGTLAFYTQPHKGRFCLAQINHSVF